MTKSNLENQVNWYEKSLMSIKLKKQFIILSYVQNCKGRDLCFSL